MGKNTSGTPGGTGNKPAPVNTINGTDNEDILFGTVGNDLINSGNGDDIIYDGAGNDTIMAGAGNDVIVHNLNDNKGFKDYFDGGSGTADTLQLVVTQDQYTTIQKAMADFAAWDKSQAFDFSRYGKDLNFKVINIEHITFEILDPAIQIQNTMTLTSGDRLIGTNLNDKLQGGPGNDTLFGLDGKDHLIGGSGDDTLMGGRGDDLLVGGAGNDCINAGAGNDVVNGSAGIDTVVHFVDENQGFHDYYQDSGTSVQNDGQDTLVFVFSDSDFAKISTLLQTIETDFAAAKKNGVVFDFSQYNSELSSLLGAPKTLNIGTKGFEQVEFINATEAQDRANTGDECYGPAQVNQAPVANPDTFVMNEDAAFNSGNNTIVLGNKLANDTDVDGDPLSVVSVQNVSLDISHAGAEFAGMTAVLTHGDFVGGNPTITLTLNGKTAIVTIGANGTETLSDPNHLFNALDSGESLIVNASYTNSDGSLTSSANQSITINGVNDAPVANPDAFIINEDDAFNSGNNTLNLGNKLVNDTDVDAETLSVVSVQNVTVDTSHAGAEFAGMSAVLTHGDFTGGNPTITLTLNGKTAIVTIAADGTETLSDPNHLFDALDAGESLIVNASYTNSDGSLTSSAAQSITINGVNDAPAANPDAFIINEDDAFNSGNNTIVLGNKLANDTDVDAETLSVVSVQNVSVDTTHAGAEFAGMSAVLTHGDFVGGDPTITLTLNGKTAIVTIGADGMETLSDPNHLFDALDAGESLIVNASYTNSDGSLTSSAAQSITINGVNDAPMANPDSFIINEDDAFNEDNNTITLGNKLANDTDVDAETLSVVSVQNVSVDTTHAGAEFAGMSAVLTHGDFVGGDPTITLTLNGKTAIVTIGADGMETLSDPNHLFDALDAGESLIVNASYTNSDGSLTSSAAQSITINGVNDAPMANPDSFIINEDDAFNEDNNTITLGNKLANDTDVDAETLSVVSVQNVSVDTSHAGAEFAGMSAVLTHGDFVGGDPTITLTLNGKTAIVTIGADGMETLSDPNHLFDALDSGESLIVNASYTNSDGSLTSSANQSVTINGVNDAPMANPDAFIMNEDDAFNSGNNTINLGNKLANDTDVDAETLSVVSVQNVSVDTSHAGAEFAGMSAVLTHGDFVGGNPTITLTLNGKTAIVTIAADGTETLSDPNHLFNALDSGESLIVNASYTNSDGSLTSSANQSVTINGVNDAPMANPDAFIMNEDDAFNSGNNTIVLGNKLTNDTDVDAETLSVVSVQNVSVDTSHAGAEFAGMSAVLTHGDFVGGDPTITLTLNGKTAIVTIGADGMETLSDPNHLFDALDSGESLIVNASYTNSDGSLTSSANQSVTINGVNDAPMANPDAFIMNEDDAFNSGNNTIVLGNKLTNDTDVDAETLSVVSVQNVSVDTSHAGAEFAGMSAVLTHGDFVGGDPTITLTLNGKTAIVTIGADGMETLSDPNHLFDALDSGESLIVNASYTNSDGSLTSSANQSVTINGVNDAPMANPDAFIMNEDDAFNSGNNTINLGNKLANDTDVDAETLSVVSVQNVSVDTSHAGAEFAGMSAVLTHGDFVGGDPTITLTLNGKTAIVTIAADGTETLSDPNHLFNALDSGESLIVNASYTNSDGSLSSSANQSITINGVNDAPVANPDAFIINEDDAFNDGDKTITLGNKLANDTDVDAETLSVVSVQNVSVDTSHAGAEFAGMSAVLTHGDFVGGDPTITLTLNGKTAIVTIAADGTETLSDPNHLFNALDSGESLIVNASYTNSDGSLASSANQSITINGVNDAPMANPDAFMVNEDDAFNSGNNTIVLGNKLANDTDVDAETLSVVSVQNVSVDTSHAGAEFAGMTAMLTHGDFTGGNPTITLTLNGKTAIVTIGADGMETLSDPNHLFDALDSGESLIVNASYTNSDGSLTSSANQSVTINGVNDAPAANPDAFIMNEDDAFNSGNNTINLGNKLANDTDVDAETLSVVSVQNVSVDTSHAGAGFAGMTAMLTHGDFTGGNPTITLTLNGKTAIVTIGANGTETLSDPNHLFNGLLTGESLIVNASYTNSDGSLTSTALQSITINGVDETLVATADTQDVTVYEAALDLSKDGADLAAGTRTGTNPTSTGETDNTGNSLLPEVSGGSGVYAFTLVGPGVTSGIDPDTNQSYTTVAGTKGVIKLFADGTYVYTLTNPIIGPQADNGANTLPAENFSYQVADTHGQTAMSTISVNVVDDFPIAKVTNGLAQNSSDTTVYGTLVNMGADTDGAHVVLSVGSMPPGLSSNGIALVYSVSPDGSTITAKAGVSGPSVFTLTGNPDGTYVFHQSAPLDLSVITSDLQSSVGAGGPQAAYYFYTNGQFGSVENAADWSLKITGSGNINPSTQGMGVDNNLFQKSNNAAETMTFNFDNEGASTVNHGTPNLSYIAKVGVTGLDAGETLTYTAYYTNGTHSNAIQVTSANLDSAHTFMVQAPTGLFLDRIDLAAGPTNTSVRLDSITTFTLDDTQPKVLNFGYKAIDGDGDSNSGTFSITETNSSALTVASANGTAVGGGLGDNVIMGGNGHDLLAGNLGNDVITGGQGGDTFIFTLINTPGNLQMQGNDTIMDLNGAQGDKLLFHNGTDIATLNAKTLFSDTGVGNNDLLISFTDGGSITLKGLGNDNIHNFTDLNNLFQGVVVVA